MRIAIVSGSRADRGALVAVKEALSRAGALIQWFDLPPAPSSHDQRIDTVLHSYGAIGSIGNDLYDNPPDLVLLHGDRYEILAAAMTAFLLGLPIAHLGGGDITEGSQDDSIRHAITKLSHIHFATCEESARRLVQMGEQPSRVYNVGDPGIDDLAEASKTLTKTQVLEAFSFFNLKHYFLVSYHPNTVGDIEAELRLFTEGLRLALEKLPNNVGLVLLDPNNDAGHLAIERTFKQMVGHRVRYVDNLPRNVYLSAMKHAVALVGNSSAGFYEAPSFGIIVLNFGDRQKGRKESGNIFNVATPTVLAKYMGNALIASRYVNTENHYGDGSACDRIVDILKTITPRDLLHKQFYNPPSEAPCLVGFGKRFTLPVNGVGIPRRSWSGGSPAPILTPKTDQLSGSWIWGAVQGLVHGFWPVKGSR